MNRYDILMKIEWVLNNTSAYQGKTHKALSSKPVNEMEEKFGVAFPADYREFLEKFGCVEGDVHILGIPKDEQVSAFEATELKKSSHRLTDIVVVRTDDFGNFDFIDLALSTAERSVLRSYSADNRIIHTMPYVDFHSYLLYALLCFENSERTADELVELKLLVDAYIEEWNRILKKT